MNLFNTGWNDQIRWILKIKKLTENRRFSFAHPPLIAKLPLFIGNQKVLGVVGLPVGECLYVGPLFVVLVQVTFPQEGLQHQGLSGFWKKAVILHKGGGVNEKRLFPVKEPPGGGDCSRRLLLWINGISTS